MYRLRLIVPVPDPDVPAFAARLSAAPDRGDTRRVFECLESREDLRRAGGRPEFRARAIRPRAGKRGRGGSVAPEFPGLVANDDAFLEIDDGLGDAGRMIGHPLEIPRGVEQAEPAVHLGRMRGQASFQ